MARPRYSLNSDTVEIGIDEAGRGPLFGRVYVAAVVLPIPFTSSSPFAYERMKDSKRFHSFDKLLSTAAYIRDHALSYAVEFIEAEEIDQINIRQAVLKAMRAAAKRCMQHLQLSAFNTLLLVDGNDFIPFDDVPYVTIEKGDSLIASIAAASILAKSSRDLWIQELCSQHPSLDTNYGLLKNKGYGTTKHMNGIKEFGITHWHRKSFAPCR